MKINPEEILETRKLEKYSKKGKTKEKDSELKGMYSTIVATTG